MKLLICTDLFSFFNPAISCITFLSLLHSFTPTKVKMQKIEQNLQHLYMCVHTSTYTRTQKATYLKHYKNCHSFGTIFKAFKCSSADNQLNRPEKFPQVTRMVLTSPEHGLLYLRPGNNLSCPIFFFICFCANSTLLKFSGKLPPDKLKNKKQTKKPAKF